MVCRLLSNKVSPLNSANTRPTAFVRRCQSCNPQPRTTPHRMPFKSERKMSHCGTSYTNVSRRLFSHFQSRRFCWSFSNLVRCERVRVMSIRPTRVQLAERSFVRQRRDQHLVRIAHCQLWTKDTFPFRNDNATSSPRSRSRSHTSFSHPTQSSTWV